MSEFKTKIPVDLKALVAKLPPRSYVSTVKLAEDRQSVELVWGCDDFKTGFTFPVDCPLDKVSSPPVAAKAASPKSKVQSPESNEPGAASKAKPLGELVQHPTHAPVDLKRKPAPSPAKPLVAPPKHAPFKPAKGYGRR